MGKLSHCVAVSKAMPGLGSPDLTVGLRRNVWFSVLAPLALFHSVPGSNPTWPMRSMTVPDFSSVRASSPLKLATPLSNVPQA